MNNSSMDPNVSLQQASNDNEEGLKGYQYSLYLTNIVICTVNLIGNFVVLVLICKRRLLGRTTNVFVFSLAMADAVCCSGAIPYNIILLLEKPMSVYLCKTYFYTLCISRTAVSYTLVLLTTEKILNILNPSRFITAGRCLFFISLVWFFSAAYNIWTIVFYTIYDSDTIPPIQLLMDSTIGMYGKTCFFSHRFRFLQTIFLSLDISVLFLIPCGILTLQFCCVIRKQHGSIKQRFETYCYIMRFLVFIFFVFIACHTPFEIATMTKNHWDTPPSDINKFYDASTSIYYTRGICNLIVYIYFKQYVCRRKKRLANANNSNGNANMKTALELPEMRPYRNMSMNMNRLRS